MRITLVIGNLRGGGAERVCVNLANAWAARGHRLTILTGSHGPEPTAYPIDARVCRRDLDWKRFATVRELNRNSAECLLRGMHGVTSAPFKRQIPLLAILRHAILKTSPDVVVAHLDVTNLRVILAMHETKLPVIVCEHTDSTKVGIGVWQQPRKLLYRRVAAVVAPHPAIAKWFERHGATARAIPNVLHSPPARAAKSNARQRRRLVTLARLSPERHTSLSILAFADIAAEFPDWDLEINGEGRLYESLEQLAASVAPGRIHLRGFTDDPYAVLSAADLFVSTSWVEGFGNAIWEALASGVPVVAMDSGAPVRSLVRDGVDGLIVRPFRRAALAKALASLMGDEERRQSFAVRAPEVVDRFSLESALRQWDELLAEVVTGK
jgi:GalNAc-alpha-(1->4)-GalNAc-alpha-(1->3)-diNAcBac-PP-undecaprenol alpha-1,4-N-acetyl-D-galactosaminyltransferase